MYNLENCVIPEDARLEKVFSHEQICMCNTHMFITSINNILSKLYMNMKL